MPHAHVFISRAPVAAAASVDQAGWLFRRWGDRRMFDRRMWILCLTSLVGEVANQASIILAGSLTFTVVYSSVVRREKSSACSGIPTLHI